MWLWEGHQTLHTWMWSRAGWDIEKLDKYMYGWLYLCNTNLAEGEKNENTLLLSIQTAYKRNTLSFTRANLSTLCSAGGVKGISFPSSESPSGLFLCSCACVGVSPSPSQHRLASRECDAGAHLLHCKRETVTGTSGHTVKSWSFKPPASCCITAGCSHARQWECVSFNKLK